MGVRETLLQLNLAPDSINAELSTPACGGQHFGVKINTVQPVLNSVAD